MCVITPNWNAFWCVLKWLLSSLLPCSHAMIDDLTLICVWNTWYYLLFTILTHFWIWFQKHSNLHFTHCLFHFRFIKSSRKNCFLPHINLVKIIYYRFLLYLFSLKNIFGCMTVCLHLCICTMYLPCTHGGQKRSWIPWNWNYGWLWATVWVLRTDWHSRVLKMSLITVSSNFLN